MWCFNINGNRHWQVPLVTGGEIVGAPAVGYGFVWFGSEDGFLYCAIVSSGTMKPGWPVRIGDPDGSVPAIANDTLYFKTDKLNPLQLLTGWEAATSAIKPKMATNVALDLEDACNACDTYVYGGNKDDILYKTSKKSSVKVWSKLVPTIDGINSTPSITEDRVYFTANGELFVVDAKDGKILSRIAVPMYHINERLTSIAIAYQRLYFASTSCTVYSYGCCKPLERVPAHIVLLPNPFIRVKVNCELQFTAIVIASDGTPMPELSQYIEYFCTPGTRGSINVKTGLFKAGSVVSPPMEAVTARLKMSYLTNLGNTIDVNLVSPPTIVDIF